MNSEYYSKYIKYKYKYLSLKNLINTQKGGSYQEPKFDTISGQLIELVRVMQSSFIPNNSSMFRSKLYFNESRCLDLSIDLIYRLAHEAHEFQNDSSYSAKIGILQHAVQKINTFLNCVKS